MERSPSFSEKVQCGHCSNVAPMEIVCRHSKVQEQDGGGPPWQAGDVYDLLKCPACSGVVLRKYFYHSVLSEDCELEMEMLYPVTRGNPEGLPEPIATAFSAAQRVRNIDPNAYGVLAGRVGWAIARDVTGKKTGKFRENRLQVVTKSAV